MSELPTQVIEIDVGTPRRSQFGPTQKHYDIWCQRCGFTFERPNLTEARFFANVHNEENHNSSLTVVDLTVASSPVPPESNGNTLV